MDIDRYLQEKKEIVDSALERYLPKKEEFTSNLHKAIQHSLFAGGKRIRPILSIASFEAVGGKGERILPFACGLEMIHTYSLIHDDLPAIDNDDYRRGKPTCHKVFGEAIAILAGDGLLTEAFRLMTTPLPGDFRSSDGGVILDLVNEVAQAAGVLGMVGGQVVDVESEGKGVDLPTVQYIHARKTGAMILASVRVGAKLGGAKGEILNALTRYGESVGLAFQIVDDILNVEGKAALMGKKTGSDLSRGKATYPSVLGLEESKKKGRELVKMAVDALKPFGPEADPLREIARFVAAREY
ncbi:MAG TPA: farnesyl diphosphate synthase [Thermodesulfobacteriota bacterium]|jgi:geranylgeranyl diphosphate synthase type II|nr:farnesyl diphosphate synthase [Thermodesulfobacteriota bacterium]